MTNSRITELAPWQAKVEALPAECETAIETAADSLPPELEITDPEGFAREIYRLVTGTTAPACGHPECAPLGAISTERFDRIEPTPCQLARMVKYGMCPECQQAWNAWLDYRIVPPINLVQIGNPARSAEFSRQRRNEEQRDTVNFQQRLIKRICTIRHNWTGEEN